VAKHLRDVGVSVPSDELVPIRQLVLPEINEAAVANEHTKVR